MPPSFFMWCICTHTYTPTTVRVNPSLQMIKTLPSPINRLCYHIQLECMYALYIYTCYCKHFKKFLRHLTYVQSLCDKISDTKFQTQCLQYSLTNLFVMKYIFTSNSINVVLRIHGCKKCLCTLNYHLLNFNFSTCVTNTIYTIIFILLINSINVVLRDFVYNECLYYVSNSQNFKLVAFHTNTMFTHCGILNHHKGLYLIITWRINMSYNFSEEIMPKNSFRGNFSGNHGRKKHRVDPMQGGLFLLLSFILVYVIDNKIMIFINLHKGYKRMIKSLFFYSYKWLD